MSGVFISYRRGDASYIAGRLHDRLARDLGREHIFRDIDAITPGVDFTTRIDSAVGSCDALVAVIGDEWVTATDPSGKRRLDDPEDWVRLEIATALQRDTLVIPVLVEDAEMPSEDVLPENLKKLARRQAMSLSDERWDTDVDELVHVLRGAMGLAPPPATISPPPSPATPPASRSSPLGWLKRLRPVTKLALAVGVVAVVLAAALVAGQSPEADRGPADLTAPQGLALDDKGNLYVADTGGRMVKRVGADGTVTVVAGTGLEAVEEGEVRATSASLGTPWALALAGDGTLFIADAYSGGIRRVDADGILRKVAAHAVGSDIQGTYAMAIDGRGHLLVTTEREVLEVRPDGTVAAFAGGASQTFAGDGGPATAAKLNAPSGLALDGDGNLFIADTGNQRIRKVGPDGIIVTVAGTGSDSGGLSGDPALEVGIGGVTAVAVGPDGSLYLGGGNQVARVSPGGRLTLVAGDIDNESGFSGDGGPATDALLDEVTAVAVDDEGRVYLSDSGNNRVRRVDRDGTITTVA